MEYIIVIITTIIFLAILKFAWNIKLQDIKKIKEIGFSKELNEITNQLPSNKEICQTILKKLNNKQVTVKEDDGNTASFYIAISNSIIIANIKNTFTRVQTIAHECIHSVQNRRTLLFNFAFSNIYLLYFIVICLLSIFKINFYPMLYLLILILLSFIYYAVRSSLEVEAMTKAKPLAKEYMEEEGSISKEEQKVILENYETINQIGIPLTNFKLALSCAIKIILYSIIALIFA